VEVQVAEYMPDAWQVWLDWHKQVAPDNLVEIEAIKSDAGRNMTYSRVIATRNPSAELSPYCWPDPLKTMTGMWKICKLEQTEAQFTPSPFYENRNEVPAERLRTIALL